MNTNPAVRSLKLLLIEDDADLCEGWEALFDILGYQYRCYQKASLALQDEAWIANVDVVISDYYLPDLNGVELVKKIRAIKPGVPVVILTGSKEAGVVSAIKAVKDCVIIHKPVNIDDLERKILELCAPSP